MENEIVIEDDRYFSFVTLYSLSSTDENSECSEGMCFRTWSLRWIGGHTLNLGLFAKSLEGHICADYGLQASTDGGQSWADVCFTGRIFELRVESQGAVNFRIWYSQGSSHNVQAYAWSHAQGGFPSQPASNLQDQLLKSLVIP